MTPEQDNFDALRRLLKLKRCEQPPPKYFNDFSQQVLARIRSDVTEDRRELWLDRVTWEAPWLQRLIEAFQAKPAWAVSFGAAVCALLIGGVIFSETTEPTAVSILPAAAKSHEAKPDTPPSPVLAATEGNQNNITLTDTNNSMNVGMDTPGSLFDRFGIKPQPVRFEFKDNGK